ncbi:hypothetical protein KIN20_009996 [Parelaphostrongylus tenuis]|uniref:Uncharacterized protein n=1 Tax=Parelaphostrongylus tenuis TaxID=148309 RepID=A0AAD5M781_PARTN|nr:hypothetical protein KIN20_009996 [Parelaphostrongylus tenuis]
MTIASNAAEAYRNSGDAEPKEGAADVPNEARAFETKHMGTIRNNTVESGILAQLFLFHEDTYTKQHSICLTAVNAIMEARKQLNPFGCPLTAAWNRNYSLINAYSSIVLPTVLEVRTVNVRIFSQFAYVNPASRMSPLPLLPLPTNDYLLFGMQPQSLPLLCKDSVSTRKHKNVDMIIALLRIRKQHQWSDEKTDRIVLCIKSESQVEVWQV